MSFSSLGLSDDLLKAVDKKGYTTPSIIQEKAIPPILEGKDAKVLSRQFSSIKKAQTLLRWMPRYSLEQGMRETVQWYKSQIKNS